MNKNSDGYELSVWIDLIVFVNTADYKLIPKIGAYTCLGSLM